MSVMLLVILASDCNLGKNTTSHYAENISKVVLAKKI